MAKPLWKRPALVIPAAIVVVGGAALVGLRSGKSGASNSPAATNTQLYTVQRTTLQETVSASGTIEPSETDDLSFTSAGTVNAVNAKAGQKVKKGEVLATIDSAALASALTEAQASLDAAQAQLSDDQSAGASDAQISSDEANVAAQAANVTAAFKNLAGASLTSPIDGTVSTVNLSVGDVLNSSGASGNDITGTGTGSGRSPSTGSTNPTGSSSDSSSAQISVVSNSFVVNLSVDTATVGKIEVGQRATVTPTTSSGNSRGGGAFPFPGGGGGFVFNGGGGGGGNNNNGGSNTNTAVGNAATGKVSSVGTVASSSSGVATFPVVISIDGQPESFHAGASASASIVYGEKANVLAVPVNGLTRSTDGSYVTVSNNGQTSKRAVTTGLTTGGQVEITNGLTEGQQVVITVPNFGRNRTGTGGNGGTGGGNGGGGNFTPPAGFAP